MKRIIQLGVETPEGQNELKRMQLRELVRTLAFPCPPPSIPSLTLVNDVIHTLFLGCTEWYSA